MAKVWVVFVLVRVIKKRDSVAGAEPFRSGEIPPGEDGWRGLMDGYLKTNLLNDSPAHETRLRNQIAPSRKTVQKLSSGNALLTPAYFTIRKPFLG